MKLVKYKVYCTTEGKWVETGFLESPPTKCPIDGSHDIDLDSITEIETRESNVMITKEDESGTQGIWKSKNVEMQCSASTVSWKTMSFAYPVRVYDMIVYPSAENIGDHFEVFAPYNIDIGSATGNASDSLILEDLSIGDSVIKVSPVLLSSVKIGFQSRIQDTNGYNDLGEIISKTNESITVSKPLTKEYKVSDSSKILFSNERIQKHRIMNAQNIHIGSGKRGGTLLPSNTVIMIKYYNSTDSTKTFFGTFGMDY